MSKEPYIDPLHKFTIEDWKRGEETESGQLLTKIADMVSKAVTPEPLTLEAMKAAIDKLNEKPVLPEDHPLCGVVEIKECVWMKGMEVIVISGDKAYCWPEGLAGKEVKVITIPEYKPEELKINWSF